MAEEEQAQEKTEEPSLKRLKEAREKGQVARSKDFNATMILLSSGACFVLFGQYMSAELMSMMRQAFDFDSSVLTLPSFALKKLSYLFPLGFKAVFPLLLMILLLSVFSSLLMGGWVFSVESLQPKFSRLSLVKGLKRMVSLKGLVEMVKSMLKFFLIAVVAVLVLKSKLPALIALTGYPLAAALSSGLSIVTQSFLLISGALILIAAIDVPFQLYEHKKQLKMTKQELKDEYKETEGKPEVKSQIRRMQQEISRRRMMAEVPKASVILTNPTHYAVALSYQKKGNRAPVVVAKGKDLVAFQINRIALNHGIPQLSVPPLARALYFSTELNAEIPRGLYVAVAQVLAYIFQLKDKATYDRKPEILQDLPIPDDLRRDAEENG
ncbi:Flagellar biosynthetic protein FlhB [Legionella massiliensis]|uniref:Flagellar biosynthetic protein FlhB n=1 Tax=Legionella massiliensis TaxID=1034943 RepID=A0A078L3P3_9GAMM|nr:flagellar biosynthesis protein FlhB [Legionella massiliensis]CDZ78563.1 Flagellar biosynthetic protein FlhB [Legionella massiliensis]CEE14301.1 Flagellar biosynthetic protein FlhB [Legionella massiliensis]